MIYMLICILSSIIFFYFDDTLYEFFVSDNYKLKKFLEITVSFNICILW